MTKIEFPQRPVAFLVYFLKSLTAWQKISILTIGLATILSIVASFAMMYGFKMLIDELPKVDVDDVWEKLGQPFWIIVICCIVNGLGYRVRNIIDAFSTPYIQNSLRVLLLNNLFLHSHDYFHNRFSGELVNKVSNINTAITSLFWNRIMNGFLPATAAIIMAVFILATIDNILAFILVLGVLSLILSVSSLGRNLGKASANLADKDSEVSGQIVDTITNIASVKNFSQKEHELSLLRNRQKPYVLAYKKFVLWENIFWGIFNLVINCLIIGTVWYLIDNWSIGQYSLGDITVCILILWDLWGRLAELSHELTQLSGDLGKMQSALNEFVRPISVEDKTNAPVFNPKDGQIKFNHVAFHYDSGHQVFKDFSLEIPSSQKIGVVGLSGAGKTTLCQLLLRNYDVQGGEIIIGGQNIADVTQSSLRKNIAVIPQDPSLFHRSLYENILYGNPNASRDEVIAASQAAQAHDFILATPEGYETTVGERGVKLSGGQRQRIAIARAILKNAPILILDEATSALDSDTERLIQSALNNAMEGRTTIVVAHRLSTLAHLDRIIVMKDGIIIEDGNLQELIVANGHFAYLWNLQAGGFLPEKL
jgi:ATP-binding cassette subfamily B protein